MCPPSTFTMTVPVDEVFIDKGPNRSHWKKVQTDICNDGFANVAFSLRTRSSVRAYRRLLKVTKVALGPNQAIFTVAYEDPLTNQEQELHGTMYFDYAPGSTIRKA